MKTAIEILDEHGVKGRGHLYSLAIIESMHAFAKQAVKAQRKPNSNLY
jgi:hypothetical protein